MPEEDPRYDLPYENALRGLTDQASTLSDIRTRTSTLFSAGVIGLPIVAGLSHSRWSWAVLLFIVAIACEGALGWILYEVWRPRTWNFRQSATGLIAKHIECKHDPAITASEIKRDLAIHMQKQIKKNSDVLAGLFDKFRIAIVLLLIEIIALVAYSLLAPQKSPAPDASARQGHRRLAASLSVPVPARSQLPRAVRRSDLLRP